MNDKRLERIEKAWIHFLKNDMAHMNTKLAVLDERTKGHGKLLVLLLTMALTLGPAILVTLWVQ